MIRREVTIGEVLAKWRRDDLSLTEAARLLVRAGMSVEAAWGILAKT